jgi:hypothetical protein
VLCWMGKRPICAAPHYKSNFRHNASFGTITLLI